MRRALVSSLFIVTAVLSACAASADQELDQVRTAIAKLLPGLKPEDVQVSPIPGLYEVRKGQDFGYVTADGHYLIQGDLIDMNTGASLTENRRMKERLAGIKELGADEAVVFAPKDEKDRKYDVTVFTDVDCGYCRKLHSQMAEYNARGIAVHYVFFPRSGPDTASFFKAEQVWCSKDRQQALTQAKQGEQLDAPTSCKNPVLKEYQLGERLGVNATPMIILPDGELVRGYVPPAALAQRLARGNWDNVKVN